MDAPEAIIANANYHAQLLNVITNLGYVPSAQKHQIGYIKDLEEQLNQSKKRVAQLSDMTKKERKEHEALRDSTGKRFAHKILGKREKFEARASKEEREYVEALEREMTERDSQNSIIQLLDEAQAVLVDLEREEQKFESAKLELAALYGRVFDGPTEAFPEDDRLEYELNDVIRRHEKIQATVNSENKAAELLARAVRAMDGCQQNMQEALGYSRYDMWGGGSLADMMERNALRNAQASSAQVEMLIAQAVRESPNVRPVGQVNIAQGSIMSDVFFDNIFTDMAFHNKIKQSAAEVLLANNRLKVERENARRRADAAGDELMRTAGFLDQLRRELDHFRRATFETYAAQNPPPPGYDVAASPVTSPSTQVPPSPETPESMPHSPPPLSPDPLNSGNSMQSPAKQPIVWKSRNPYAAAMAERTRSLSQD